LTRLYLVSCAQTLLGKEGVFETGASHRLSREGMKHARLLARRLQEERIESFYSSPWGGALQTASILAARHRRGVIRIRELEDMDYGQWSEKTADELKEGDPDAFITWQFEPHNHRMPGGETIREVQDRVVPALERIVEVEAGGGVCVVSHPVPVKTAMCHYMDHDLSLIWLTPRQASTTLNVIDFDDDEARVVEAGSTEHLGEEVRT
jgi:broad specificity phosphatase PhoE